MEQQCRRRIAAHLFRLELLQLLAGLPLLLLRDPSFAETGDEALLAGYLPCGIGGASAEDVQGIVSVAVCGVDALPGVNQYGSHRMVAVLHGLNQRRRVAGRARKVRAAVQQQPCRRGNLFFQSGHPAAARGQAEERCVPLFIAVVHLGSAVEQRSDGFAVGKLRRDMQRCAAVVVLVTCVGRNLGKELSPALLLCRVRIVIKVLEFPERCHRSIDLSRFSMCLYRCPKRAAIVRTSS